MTATTEHTPDEVKLIMSRPQYLPEQIVSLAQPLPIGKTRGHTKTVACSSDDLGSYLKIRYCIRTCCSVLLSRYLTLNLGTVCCERPHASCVTGFSRHYHAKISRIHAAVLHTAYWEYRNVGEY